MALGNGKPKHGDKGSNFSYELKSLKQQAILASLLQDILTATEDINEDAEILLVRDTANGDIIVQQIRIYDRLADTWTTSYQNLDGTDYVPVIDPAIYEYLDSSATLSQVIGADGLPHGGPEQKGFRILGTDGTSDYQLSTNASGQLQVDVISSALPTGAATEITLGALLTAFGLEDFASETTLGLLEAKFNSLGQKASTASAPVVLSTEQEVILQAIADNNTPKTAISLNTTGTGFIIVGASEISFFNNGSLDATVNGTPLPPGVTRTFGFKNDIDAAINFDGNGEQLLIDYMV